MGILSMSETDTVPRQVIDYCAFEVDRQGAGPLYVPRMLDAWYYACVMGSADYVTEANIIRLNKLVMGTHFTEMGYRKTNVSFDNFSLAIRPSLVPRAMESLIGSGVDDPIQFTYEFLIIHPFEDGNGRVASLLYNLINGTIKTPETLPEFNF